MQATYEAAAWKNRDISALLVPHYERVSHRPEAAIMSKLGCVF